MSVKKTLGIAAVVIVVGVSCAYLYLRSRPQVHPPEIASPEPAGFHETAPAPNPVESSAAKPVAAKSNSPDAGAPPSAPPVDPALPLRAGEVLDYTANVSDLNNVATLRLQVAGRGNFLGKSTWHLRAFAHTQSPLRMVFELDDEFDSYSDAVTMASLQYEMHLSERGQKVESVQRMTSTGKEPATANATEARVLPGTRDPLGLMQFLRNVDWSKTPEVRCPVYDGHQLHDVRSKLAASSTKVSVAAGDFSASKIAIRVFDNGAELKDASFVLYLANNPARTPVLLEAVMPFATARVELQKSN
jgi:uncharacterized protein DUF3108